MLWVLMLLHKDIETLKASIDLSRDGNGEVLSQRAANSCECGGHMEQISNLELQVAQIADVLHKFEERMDGMDSKILHNTAKSMACDYTLTGARYYKDEDPKLAARSFLKYSLSVETSVSEILKARRVKVQNPLKRKNWPEIGYSTTAIRNPGNT